MNGCHYVLKRGAVGLGLPFAFGLLAGEVLLARESPATLLEWVLLGSTRVALGVGAGALVGALMLIPTRSRLKVGGSRTNPP